MASSRNHLNKSKIPGFGHGESSIHIDPKGTYEKAALQNTKRTIDVSKPHYYGRIDGVHIFHALHDVHSSLIGAHVENPSDESLSTTVEAAAARGHHSVVVHGSPPPSLRHLAPPVKHANNYDWHDGHTDHHLVKKSNLEAKPGNAQAAGVGVKSYPEIARHYGTITPGQKTHLKFYPDMDKHLPKVENLVKEHGFQTYYAGGKHGKPDLANKNYNTKHLMIYDPEAGSGGDFGEHKYTDSWRKLHELAHALTYPDLNKMYGEGRRLGKLGPRTHREAARAVHWEWLVAHKQRELGEKIGIKIPEADFHRELNTVMHDAVHRAVHGQFTEPSDEGFYPTDAKIPLEFSMKQISDAAKAKNMHDPSVEPPAPTGGDYGLKKAELEPGVTIAAYTVAEKIKQFQERFKPEQDQKITAILLDIESRLASLQENEGDEEKKFKLMQEALRQIKSEIKELKAAELAETEEKVVVPSKEMLVGVDSPERVCSACEQPSESCSCYLNLPRPRVEFDGRTFTFFFKSQWNEEDRLNFVDDMKKRTGLLLEKSRLKKAEEARTNIRKKLR